MAELCSSEDADLASKIFSSISRSPLHGKRESAQNFSFEKNLTIRRPLDHRKEVVWTCLQFIGSGENHFAMHSERGKKTRHTDEEVGRQPQGMDRPGVR